MKKLRNTGKIKGLTVSDINYYNDSTDRRKESKSDIWR